MGIQLVGIAIVIASLAAGSGQSTTTVQYGFFAYTPNLGLAIVGVLVTIIGAILDPIIEVRLAKSREPR